MHKERPLGPGYGVILLASITLAAVYFTTEFVEYNENYFHSLIGKVDRAIDDAYGASRAVKAQP